jgi:hypothetical protein
MQKLRIVTLGISGGSSPRPPNYSKTLPRAYTYAAKVWALFLVQGKFLSPRAKPNSFDSQLSHLGVEGRHACAVTIEKRAQAP